MKDLKVHIVEVGPRDGLQNWGSTVQTQNKVNMIMRLYATGLERVEITSFVHPKWVPQLSDAEQVCAMLPAELVEKSRALVPNQKGYERAVRSGIRNVIVNIGATEAFNEKNLNATISDTLKEIESICQRAVGDNVKVDASISVSFGCPYSGKVEPDKPVELARRCVELGCSEVSFGDTVGYANPKSVSALLELALKHIHVPIFMHFHDTRGLALANTVIALEYGIRGFEGSVGGIGGCPFAPGATGNVATEDLIYMLHVMGYQTSCDLDSLVMAARELSGMLGSDLPGKVHKAGIVIV